MHGFYNPSTVSLLLDTVVGRRSGARRRLAPRPSAERSASRRVAQDSAPRRHRDEGLCHRGGLRLAARRARWQQRRREGAGREECAINLMTVEQSISRAFNTGSLPVPQIHRDSHSIRTVFAQYSHGIRKDSHRIRTGVASDSHPFASVHTESQALHGPSLKVLASSRCKAT